MEKPLLDRYVEWFNYRGERIEIINDTIYRVYSDMIVPFGPVKDNYVLTKENIAQLFRMLSGKILRHTTTMSSSKTKEWYAVICDEFISMDKLSSKHRSEMNRGLKNCIVKRIDVDYLSNKGFDVYAKAHQKYSGNVKCISENKYKENTKMSGGFDDILHYWGVFQNDKLVAYSTNYIFNKKEVNYTSVKIAPDSLKYYPAYALFYKMNEYYLEKHNFDYVNDGFRSILHHSSVQEYLIKKFNFKKYGLKLHLSYRFPYSVAIRLLYPFRTLIGRIDNRAAAILALESMSRYK